MPELRTRKPTGQVAFPLLLLEGEEKAGKTFAALSLSASGQVGRTFVLELDEPTADEYAELGPFEMLEHTGTYVSVRQQLEAACAVPPVDGRPNVIILDSATALWDVLKDWATLRARSSRKNREVLQKDPDADIEVTMNYWNDAKERWYGVINLLRRWPGIAILVARGKEVAKVIGGQPVAGQTDYSVQAEKGTTFACTAWVQMRRPHTARLMAVRSLNIDVPDGGLELPRENVLEHLIFDVLASGREFGQSNLVVAENGIPVNRAKRMLLDNLTAAGLREGEAKQEAAGLWHLAGISGPEVPASKWTQLMADCAERIEARAAGEPAAGPPAAAGEPPAAEGPPPAPEPEDNPGAEGIRPDVAAMPITEVTNLLLALEEPVEGKWTYTELRQRLSMRLDADDAEAGEQPPGEAPETLVQLAHDVDSMAPRDVVAQLEQRGLDTKGGARACRTRLVQTLYAERAKGAEEPGAADEAAAEQPPLAS